MFNTHTATSRARLRGRATHRARGARPAAPSTAGAGSLARRLRAGAAAPTATSVQAVTRMTLETRKSGEYMDRQALAAASVPPGAARAGWPCGWIECRALRLATSAAKSPRRRRARLIGVLALVLVASLVLAPSALANFLMPKSGGSPNADQIASLYKIILYIAAVVFVIVEGALFYSVLKFRARKGRPAAQIHGNTRLEIGWTVAAALILVVLTVVTFVKLPSIINPPNSGADASFLTASVTEPSPPNGKKLTICVVGRQYIWRYTYGAGCLNNSFNSKLAYSYTEMVVPADVTVVLDIQSFDVVHSWWIPSLGGKVDAVPGYTTYTWFKIPADKVGGLYHGQCAQLCGNQHAFMTAQVRVVTPDEYAAWIARQKQLIQEANAQVTQLRQSLLQSGQVLNQSGNG
jgi:cytochrome c oxidase subunit 2